MLGIISAVQFETEGLLQQIEMIDCQINCGIKFYIGKCNNVDVIIAACGEGKVNAARCAQIMISFYKVKNIINVGVAGALSDEVAIDEVVIADKVVQYDFDMTAIKVPLGLIPRGNRTSEYPWGEDATRYIKCADYLCVAMKNALNDLRIKYREGIIATGDLFVANKKTKVHIVEKFGAIACEMEGAAIGYVCVAANVGFAEIRKISDGADDVANDNYFNYSAKYSIEDIVLKIFEYL